MATALVAAECIALPLRTFRRDPPENRVSGRLTCLLLGPPDRRPFTVSFLEEGSPTKVDYRKKEYPYSNLSTGGPRLGKQEVLGLSERRDLLASKTSGRKKT